MEDCYRQDSDKIASYTRQVDADLAEQEPSWSGLRFLHGESAASRIPDAEERVSPS